MQLKNYKETEIIEKKAESRTISTAVNKIEDQETKAKLLEIARDNTYSELKQILPKVNPDALAVLYPIYCSLS